MFKAAFFVVVVFSLNLLAQPRFVEAGEKLDPIHLLEFADEPGHFIFIAKGDSQYHGFDVAGKVVTELELVNGFALYDGGTLSLEFKPNLQVFVPSSQTPNYAKGRTESYLMPRFAPRERLEKRPHDADKLEALGLGAYLKPSEVPRGQSNSASTADKKAAPERRLLPSEADVLLVQISTEPKVSYEREVTLKKQIAALIQKSSGCVQLDAKEQILFDKNQMVYCPRAEATALFEELEKIADLHVERLTGPEQFMATSSAPRDLAQAIDWILDRSLSIAQRMTAVRWVSQPQSGWTKMDPPVFAKSLGEVHWILAQFESQIEALSQAALEDRLLKSQRAAGKDWTWEKSQKATPAARIDRMMDPIYVTWIDPLEEAHLDLLRALGALADGQTSRLVLVHAAAANGRSLRMMDRPAGAAEGTSKFSRTYMDWLLEQISEMNDFPVYGASEDVKKAWRSDGRMGGIYSQLNMMGNLMSPYRPEADALFSGRLRFRNSALLDLGLTERHRELQKQIIQFVADADQIVAQNLPRLNSDEIFTRFADMHSKDENVREVLHQFWNSGRLTGEQTDILMKALPRVAKSDAQDLLSTLTEARHMMQENAHEYEATGHNLLDIFIQELSFAPDFSVLVPDFKLENWQSNTLEIIIELLDNREQLLSTSGAYTSVLEAAVAMQRNYAATDARGRRPSLRIEKQLVELGRVIQSNFLERLPELQRREHAGCELLLKPALKRR